MKEELEKLITQLDILYTKDIIERTDIDQKTKREKIYEKSVLVSKIYDLIRQLSREGTRR
jgi:hypothetical protein